jgi:hypothetical protein
MSGLPWIIPGQQTVGRRPGASPRLEQVSIRWSHLVEKKLLDFKEIEHFVCARAPGG